MSRLQLVQQVFSPNEEGISEWISTDTIRETDLWWGGNGAQRHGVMFSVNYYLYEQQRGNSNAPSGTITAVRTVGIRENHNGSRPIRSDIRQQLLSSYSGCIVCGCTSSLVIDHKNHLYNDPRVVNQDTQDITDFQVLCNHCNLQKRQTSVRERQTNIRYPATSIPQLSIFGIDYIEGNHSFDMNDPHTMIGTYWYDPIRFMNEINNR